MSNLVRLLVSPLEPLHLGLGDLGGPESFSVDSVTRVPPPTTILGALGNYLNVRLTNVCNGLINGSYSFEDLIQLVSEIFGEKDISAQDLINYNKEPLLWGPLIYMRGNGKYYVSTGDVYIERNELLKFVESIIKKLLKPTPDESPTQVEKRLIVQESTRIGVSIDRSTGTVSNMYRARFVNYKEDIEMVYLLKRPSNGLLGSMLNESYGSSNNIGGGGAQVLTRLGGEGRVALISFEDGDADLWGGGELAVTLQPILYYQDRAGMKLSEIRGLECIDEVYGIYSNGRLKVRTMHLGLGFSEVCGVRRPILQALPAGTIIKLRKECGNAKSVGLLSMLGYGSLLKL
ncbi:hypothetical protein GCM10007981_10340 [Thermocladium modestius]|uniref:Uncharacterized protein n=1 Tax=Thermocladium modestius TaxID=62609 RepID=A0A830GVA6_9CREN|nr:type III-B CRISPR module-associated Cmr3 family protein [Thermocladium modestius]GGP20800.1 hypothetical protein GCM10007981_10340 [Thermocladium modestius]